MQVGLALAVFFAAEAARRVASRSRVAGWLLGNQLEFEAYYREHPPRPFLYYVLYPAFFPYWLFAPEARHEFLLYKGYTLASFALLLASTAVGYFRAFPPELGARAFVPLALGSFAVESIVVLMFLMPIVTSVVHLHQTKAPLRLGALLLVGLVSVSFAVVRLERRRDPVVSFATRQRVRLRTAASPEHAKKAQIAALRAAWAVLKKEKGEDIDTDGKVLGAPIDAAHDALGAFYKNDEANAFDAWYASSRASKIVVVYFEARRGHPPIWLAMDRAGNVTHDDKRLPRGAFVAMQHAAD